MSNIENIRFLGEYASSVDAKGRFVFPSAFKKQLNLGEGQTSASFVLKRGIEKCLSLIPMSKWNNYSKQIESLNDFDPAVREFRRKFLSGAIEVELDSAGRLLMPKNLMDYASLSKDIILISVIDQIEIWDEKIYKDKFENYSSEEFSVLAQKVMQGSASLGSPDSRLNI